VEVDSGANEWSSLELLGELFIVGGCEDIAHSYFAIASRWAVFTDDASRTAMKAIIGDIQLLLSLHPFVPFVIVTRNGQRHRVASADHAGINPRGSRVHVWFDDDSGVTIAEIQIVALEKQTPAEALGRR
jgi:hypothetical protein